MSHPDAWPKSFDVEEFNRELQSIALAHLNIQPGLTPPALKESMQYTLQLPGKRVRPRLCLAVAQMLGLSRKAALPAAVAVEIVHAFTLIHDDLPCMDNDDFRRGKPSNHRVYGEAMALLAGDGLSSLAPAVMISLSGEVTGPALLKALSTLLWAMGPSGVIAGQALELSLTESMDLDELVRVQFLKTSAIFLASVLIPRDLAGISDDSQESRALTVFAESYGLAFQICDDLEDFKQDGSSQEKNILSLMGSAEAISLAHGRLEHSVRELDEIWGAQAYPLREISGALLGRLGNHS